MLNTVIIDDDEATICFLINSLKKLTSYDINIVGTASNFSDGLALIKRTQPDIVILDIKLPDKNGFEIYNEFKAAPFKIIFCSSYPQYAIDALRKYADGYLIKPVDFIELQETIQCIYEKQLQEQKQLLLEDKYNALNAPEIAGKSLFFETEYGFIVKNSREIEYCYANQAYSYLVTYSHDEILVSKSLKELEEILPQDQFYRTHRSYMINIHYIRKFIHAKESYVVLKSGLRIPVSTRATTGFIQSIRRMLAS